jgi:hypothetical protein
VHIPETLFNLRTFLADHRKTEMAGLDDSRVDGAHRDFVHAVAFHGDEGIIVMTGAPLAMVA